MAAEIQFDSVSGRNCYVQVRNSVGQIWNTAGAAFEAYATGSIADYDIAATEQGTASGIYTASMPAAAAGVYTVVAKERSGGAPAEADVTVGVGEIAWSGTAVTVPADRAGVNAEVLDVLNVDTMIDGKTFKEAVIYVAAMCAGRISGAGTGTEVFKGLDEATTRVTVTVDASGNRTDIVYG